jgi:hypothetical protein
VVGEEPNDTTARNSVFVINHSKLSAPSPSSFHRDSQMMIYVIFFRTISLVLPSMYFFLADYNSQIHFTR